MARRRFQMTSVLGKQMYPTEMHTSTLDSTDVSKPHSNLEGFGLSSDSGHLLTHVHQCMYSRMEGRLWFRSVKQYLLSRLCQFYIAHNL